MKPLNPLEMADQLDRPVWWLTKPEGDQRRAAAALLREMAAEIDRLRAISEQRGQCGETCERAKLCATCAQPITAPTGSPLRTSFDAWWDHGHDWGGSLQAACLSAFKAGAASVLKGGAL